MRVELQMVGAYHNTNKTIKNVPFVNGRASLICADEHVAGICRYLEQFGAYPLIEAEIRQAKLDKAAGKAISKRVALDRVARAEAALKQAQLELDELNKLGESQEQVQQEPELSRKPPPRVPNAEPFQAEQPPEAPEAPTQPEIQNGGSSDQEATRRERSEAGQGGKGSGKNGQRRK